MKKKNKKTTRAEVVYKLGGTLVIRKSRLVAGGGAKREGDRKFVHYLRSARVPLSPPTLAMCALKWRVM